MPVKNVKRKTNDGFEGVITGLNDKEKEIIADSVGIEANPVDEATETLTKLKVGDTTYGINVSLNKDATFAGDWGIAIGNTIELTEDEMARVRSGEVIVLYGNIYISENEMTGYAAVRHGDGVFMYANSNISEGGGEAIVVSIEIPESGTTMNAFAMKSSFAVPPSLPSDASTKNYTLEANNGTIAWTESGGGATYTAGKNISISESNEISVADEMSNLKSIELANSDSRYQNIYLSSQYNSFSMKKKDGLPRLFFSRNSTPYKSVELVWSEEPYDGNSQIYFSLHNVSTGYYAFTSRSKIPDVPTGDGTYVLKAVVSSGTLTYSWVKEGE